MQDNGLLDIIEQIQRTQDPLVTKAQQERENKSPFRPGGLTSIKTSLPETDSSLPAPTSTLRSDYGTGYSRSTEATRRMGDVYRDSPYLPLERGSVPSAGSPTKHYGAGAAQSSSGHAFQGSGYPDTRSTTGQLPQPLPLEYPSAADSGQETSDLQAQYPLPSGQPRKTPRVYKRPATEAVEEEEIHQRKRRPYTDQSAIQTQNVEKNIAKAELREQQKAKAQQKEADKPRLAAERERRDTEKREKAARDKVEKDAQNKARREKSDKERMDKQAAMDKERRDMKEEQANKRQADREADDKKRQDMNEAKAAKKREKGGKRR